MPLNAPAALDGSPDSVRVRLPCRLRLWRSSTWLACLVTAIGAVPGDTGTFSQPIPSAGVAVAQRRVVPLALLRGPIEGIPDSSADAAKWQSYAKEHDLRWVEVGGCLALCAEVITESPSVKALRDAYGPILDFVNSLTPEQLEHLQGRRPLDEGRFDSTMIDLLRAGSRLRAGGFGDGRRSSGGRRTVRITALPVLRCYRAGSWVADLGVVSGFLLGAEGYGDADYCTGSTDSQLEPWSTTAVLPGGEEAGWLTGRYANGQANGQESARRDRAASLLRREALVFQTPTYLSLGELAHDLSVEGTDTVVVDKRQRADRLLITAGSYEPLELVNVVCAACSMDYRLVGECLFLAPQHRLPLALMDQRTTIWGLNELCLTKLRPLATGLRYRGLVLPWQWFIDRRQMDYASLEQPARSFVEDIWWYNRHPSEVLGSGVVIASMFKRRTADWFYTRFGAGSQDGAPRREAAEELANVSFVCEACFMIELVEYQAGGPIKGIVAVLPDSAKATLRPLPADLWYAARGKRIRLFMSGSGVF